MIVFKIIFAMIVFRIIPQWMRFMRNSSPRKPPRPGLRIRSFLSMLFTSRHILLFLKLRTIYLFHCFISDSLNCLHPILCPSSTWTLICFIHPKISWNWLVPRLTWMSQCKVGWVTWRTFSQQAAALPKGAKVEIEAVAIVGNISDAKWKENKLKKVRTVLFKICILSWHTGRGVRPVQQCWDRIPTLNCF